MRSVFDLDVLACPGPAHPGRERVDSPLGLTVLLIALVAQRHIVSGLTFGAVKQ